MRISTLAAWRHFRFSSCLQNSAEPGQICFDLSRPAPGLCRQGLELEESVIVETPIPEHVDYDLWCGPAPHKPLMRKRLHYDWHWVFDTGNGDVGNQGIHQMDIARWMLGEKRLSKAVLSVGGRVGYDDDGPRETRRMREHEQAILNAAGRDVVF